MIHFAPEMRRNVTSCADLPRDCDEVHVYSWNSDVELYAKRSLPSEEQLHIETESELRVDYVSAQIHQLPYCKQIARNS